MYTRSFCDGGKPQMIKKYVQFSIFSWNMDDFCVMAEHFTAKHYKDICLDFEIFNQGIQKQLMKNVKTGAVTN